MYEFFNQISNLLTQPFLNLARSFESIPILFAFLLGIVGAMAPCQFTGNIGAITLYGNKSLQKELAWMDVLFFTLGKVVVFTGLGILVWLLGRGFESQLTLYFPWFRKLIGPMFIMVGIFMLGMIKIKWTLTLLELPKRFFRKGKIGSFLMGVSFSIGFCPTMFVLFFVTLMPIVFSTSYGVVLPSLFAMGTSLPLFIALFLIWYYGASGAVMKKGTKIGLYIQRASGVILVVLGILDTITYWTI
ncbi:urease accessory protein UreH domain-containing protein [Metabacillus halosaccharovorans]|uniref:urease accessory protein UreH domain-containing protein n=1 Tax=Metabacillus halosaccharovorans TaxID=930124 RepID=UPI000C80410F|nr:sulfite exporter TauE/SafE family protein [Metabacillus halosaccharovorans]MCM3441514.1 sulfite exporter TauE/SafE family protein [Metabacillus halosaccharovorans]PMC36358.1 cytochrome C biosynthesis protein [Bacillus sp. UMB0899]